MTKITKNIQVIREVNEKVVCDLCGCDAEKKPSYREGSPFEHWDGAPDFEDNLDCGGYTIWEPVEIEYEAGVRWPEGGTVQRLTIDMCPACFRNRFLPWFKKEGGVIPSIEENDY
jgi:hypothetical protein